MRPNVHWTLALVPFLACCGGDAGWTGTVRDSASVVIVENGERGAWDANEAWQFEETLRIGTAEGEPAYQFGSVVSVDEDSDGNLYMLDQQAQQVRVFQPSHRASTYERWAGRATDPAS